MKKIVILTLLLASFTTMANHHEGGFEHMIEFTQDGFGFDVDNTSAELENGTSKVKTDIKSYDLNLNYAHAINSQFWIQGLLSYSKTKTDSDTTTSGNVTSTSRKEDSYGLGVAAVYNFDHDVANSFYGKIGFGIEAADNSTNNIKVDIVTYGIEFGKRWSLERITNIKNLSYYISARYQLGSGDTNISGTEVDTDIDNLSINLLGIALFF